MSTAATGFAATPAVTAAARVPASFFSIVLGLAGLGATWRAAARAYGVSPWLADALLATACAVWVAVAAAQLVKLATARTKLAAELSHPVEGSLASLGPTSLLLLAAGLAPAFRTTAVVLFWIGAAGHVAFAVWIVGRWLEGAVDPKLVTPAMYLPPVAGNLVASIAASAVGQADLAYVFFGTGVVAWLLVGSALLGRYLSAGELPAAVRPLLGIEIAPPAVALVAWQGLEGASPDTVSGTFLGFALFQALVVLRLIGRFREVASSPAYWAFTFPLAALASAVLRQSSAAPGGIAGAISLPLFVVANAIVAVVAWQTLVALSRGKLLPPG